MKKLLCVLLALAMTAALLPAAVAGTEAAPKHIANDAVIDSDGSDGYTGDYVVVYNPSTSVSDSKSTGNMSGLIETEIEPYSQNVTVQENDFPVRIDVDPILHQKAIEAGAPEKPAQDGAVMQTSFEVGDTRSFIIMNYSPAGWSVQFKVLAKGEHCYIWTPTSTAQNVYPLDAINPDFAQMAADEFDSKFDLMQSSFGNHSNGSQGDGRLHMLYYNIDDGWQPGQGYIGGYFYALDLMINGLPILNIDTYPGVHYVNAEGVVNDDITRSYGTMVHEYQHLINYSEAGSTDTWINECMSAAAEEICYPGSSICGRIQSWTDYYYSENNDWHEPPREFGYVPAYSLHNGFSMYDWNNNLDMDDLLVLYAQVSLFAQYIYTQYGNTTFHGLMQELKNGRNFVQGFQNVTGQNTADFVANFRVAVTANTAPEVLNGVYGFRMQEGYDPSQYHAIENLYSLLGPVVFTGSQCSIKGGGAICIKPVGGVYNPPAGASSGLRYFGVTRTDNPPEPPTPVPMTGISVTPEALEMEIGDTAQLIAAAAPVNASDFTVTWAVSDPAVVSVEANGLSATVTALAAGSATVTVTAHDNVSGADFTSSASVTVNAGVDYLPGDVDMDGTVGVTDAVLALRHAMGIITLSDLQIEIGDMDGNGSVTVTDAVVILRMAMGVLS